MGVLYHQVYNTTGGIWFSAIIAAFPIIVFIGLLAGLKMQGYKAGLIAAALAAFISIFVYRMPFTKTFWAGMYGVMSGIYPVATIVIGAIFLYKLTVKTGKFDIIKDSIVAFSPDRRIQLIVVAYCFGAFLEGAAGFGAPVAITAVILVGVGFPPVQAAGLCLLANIAGGSYGAMGIPVTTPAALTDLSALEVASKTGYIIPFISLALPFILVWVVDGLKGIKETFPALLVGGGAFAVTQWVVLNTIGAPLVDILSASAGLIALYIYLKPKQKHSTRAIIGAWMPFILLTVIVILFSQFTLESLVWKFSIPTLDGLVYKMPPVVSEPVPFKAVFSVDFLTSTTSAIVYAGLLTILIFKVSGETSRQAFSETMKELAKPIATICAVLAFAYICNYSGMSSTLGLAFASTGAAFPLFAPVLGWIGVFLTGSVVNSGSLFAPLQTITASQIGISEAGMVAANIIGGDMAKMISPQSIAVAAAAVGIAGQESKLLKFTLKISVIFLAVVGIINLVVY